MNDIGLTNLQPGIQAKVLVISDHFDVARIWCSVLQQINVNPTFTNTGEEALQIWADLIPDLIVIDVHSKDLDGIDLVYKMRELTIVPIILLTPRNNETHILEAYKAGVDECEVKPISPMLFLAKVMAWLKRTWSMPADSLDSITVGGLQLEPASRGVILESNECIKLTNLEFRLLHLMMSHPGWVFNTEEIIQKVWGYYGGGDSNLLKNLVYRLRRKIDPDSENLRYIHTEAGIGYKFQDKNS